MRELMAVTKALADESRVRILLALQPGELCVCQIVELLNWPPPRSPSTCRSSSRPACWIAVRRGDGCSIALPMRTGLPKPRKCPRWSSA